MAREFKAVEIVITDERGEQHTLRHRDGIVVMFPEGGAILASTQPDAAAYQTLAMAAGRWISHRITYQG